MPAIIVCTVGARKAEFSLCCAAAGARLASDLSKGAVGYDERYLIREKKGEQKDYCPPPAPPSPRRRRRGEIILIRSTSLLSCHDDMAQKMCGRREEEEEGREDKAVKAKK